jgi:hypothetical protein
MDLYLYVDPPLWGVGWAVRGVMDGCADVHTEEVVYDDDTARFFLAVYNWFFGNAVFCFVSIWLVSFQIHPSIHSA